MMNKFITAVILLSFPMFAFASEGGAPDWRTFGWRVAMFVLFVALLYYFARNPVKKMLIQRTEDIKFALAEAERAKDAAAAQVKEYEAKVAQLEKELEEMKEGAKKMAEAERSAMLEDAARQVEQMKRFAVHMIEAETEKARQELRREIVNVAYEEAKERLVKDIAGAKADKILNECVKRIGER